MYELLLFTGGVYKFDEFKEFIEDIGGLIIEMESFKVSRGMYFLSEEMRVLIVVPEEEKEIINTFTRKIKGNLEPILMENKEIEKVILIFEIHKKLQLAESMNTEDILNYLLSNPDFIYIKNYNLKSIDNEKILENIEDVLILMEEMNIIKKLEKNSFIHYQIKNSL
jgi:hypothetical protein